MTFHQRLLSVHSLNVFQTCLDFDVFFHISIYIFRNAFQNVCLKALTRFLISPPPHTCLTAVQGIGDTSRYEAVRVWTPETRQIFVTP